LLAAGCRELVGRYIACDDVVEAGKEGDKMHGGFALQKKDLVVILCFVEVLSVIVLL
jgi:hypothetical protein